MRRTTPMLSAKVHIRYTDAGSRRSTSDETGKTFCGRSNYLVDTISERKADELNFVDTDLCKVCCRAARAQYK